MKRSLFLSVAVLSLWLGLVSATQAQVFIRAPFVRVGVGDGVYVRAPFVNLYVPPAGPVYYNPYGPVVVSPPTVYVPPAPQPVRHDFVTSRARTVRTFKSLSEAEILALAISLEEEDARIYGEFAEGLKSNYPATAEALTQMRHEEDGHRHRLIELYRQKFGEHI